MIKTLLVSVLLTVSASLASASQSCVIQVLKSNTTNQQAHFVFSCGSETIASHATTPFDQLSSDEVTALKVSYMQVLVNAVGSDASVSCFEQESELFWIGICTKK